MPGKSILKPSSLLVNSSHSWATARLGTASSTPISRRIIRIVPSRRGDIATNLALPHLLHLLHLLHLRTSDDHFRHDSFRKHVVRRHFAVRDALLKRVARHLFPRGPVLLDPVRKQVSTHQLPHLPRVRRKPRYRVPRHRGIQDPLDRTAL